MAYSFTPLIRSGLGRFWAAALFLGPGLGIGGGAEPAFGAASSSSAAASFAACDDYLPESPPPSRDPRWYFAGRDPAQITNVFEAAGVSPEQTGHLMSDMEWEVVAPGPESGRVVTIALSQLRTVGVWVAPPPREVLLLKPKARAQVYAVLAGSPQNPGQCRPFRFEPQDLERRLAKADLPPEVKQWVRGLAYPDGDSVCLADIEALRHVCTSNQLGLVLKALHQPSPCTALVR